VTARLRFNPTEVQHVRSTTPETSLSVDAGKVGVAAAQLMDDLVADQGEIGDDQTIGEVMLLAEVRGTDETGDYTYIRFRCSDDREWVQRGLLHACLDQDGERVVDEDDD
jgi:hypothetical protein